MAIPDYQTCMLPLLKFYEDGKDHTSGKQWSHSLRNSNLLTNERREMLPSGQQEVFEQQNWMGANLHKESCAD